MLSLNQRQEFDRIGVVRLPGAVPPDQTADMCNRVWDFLASEHAASRHDRATWPAEKPWGFQRLTHADAFSAMATDSVREACAELLADTPWNDESHWGRPLVTFPERGATWTVPTAGWHIDGGLGPQPGITVFCNLDIVEPQGGGTLVLAGSHRLVAKLMSMTATTEGNGQPLSSRVIKAKLGAANQWLDGLWNADARSGSHMSYLDEATVIDGVPVRVMELTGRPGDAVIMSTHTLHAAAPNTQHRPRMTLVQTFV